MERFYLRKDGKVYSLKVCALEEFRYEIWSRPPGRISRWQLIAFTKERSAMEAIIQHRFGFPAGIDRGQ